MTTHSIKTTALISNSWRTPLSTKAAMEHREATEEPGKATGGMEIIRLAMDINETPECVLFLSPTYSIYTY